MPINLLDDNQASMGQEPINLLAEEPSSARFEDLSPEDQEKAMDLARKQISAQHPNMPDWMRDLLLHMAPKNKSPMLEKIADSAESVTGFIPAMAGGALQGASYPIRGVASMIPTDFTQKLANSRDLRDFFPHKQGLLENTAELGAELIGGGGLFGKLMQGVKGASALARVPKALQTPVALGGAGYIATPGTPTDKAIGAGGALALGGAGTVASKALNKTADKLAPFLRGLTSKSTPEALVESVQKPHDALQNTADELYGQVRNAIKKREINFSDRGNRSGIHAYEDGDVFGVSANPEKGDLSNNMLSMKRNPDGTASVIHASVKNKGQGLGKQLYKAAIDDTLAKGLKFQSDSIVSDDAMRVYKALEKEGYKFKYNPKTEPYTDGSGAKSVISENYEGPVVELVSKPQGSELQKLISSAREYFPKNSSSVNNLFKQAESGDYDAIHKIQSSLYKKGTKQLSGDDLVKENQGEDIIDLRGRINDLIDKHLVKSGHLDVAHVLRQGKKAHKEIMDTYYAPNLRKGIGKMVQRDLRLVPENPEKLFNQNSVPMKEFLAKHPEAAKHAQEIKEKEEAAKALNSILTKGGVAGGLTFGAKTLHDLFK